ncbi:MAG: hypothetical protein WCH04_18635 [Gammaproteobacteria bacterium]
MKCIELVPLDIEVSDNLFVRRCLIRRIDGGNQIDEMELWFQFDTSIMPPEDDDCDSYLLAVFMDAMKEGRNVNVKGTVSKWLLSNLIEYQAAWNKWLPDIYSLIEISVDSVRANNNIAVSGAICAFSGGVDSTFSVWRHSQRKCHYRSQEIKLCSIVHGFDIPLADEVAFDNARKRAEKTLKDINVDIVPIRTNYKKIAKANWEHAFSCALVATLSNFKKVAGICIVGSSEPYDSLVIPWGSSPITDHLLSSDEFNVIHDGASHSRTEKVKDISEWKIGVENLRVCWEGDLKDRNCGKCEKCLRTQLNFLVTGNPIPSCFPDYKDSDISLNKVVLRNDADRSEWQQIFEFAKKNHIEGLWVKQLHGVIKRKSIINIVFPRNSFRREIAKNLAKKLSWR